MHIKSWVTAKVMVALLMLPTISIADMNDLQCLTSEFVGPEQNRQEYIAATLEAAMTFNIPPAILVGIKLVESGRGLNPQVSNRNTNSTTDRGYYQVNAEVWLPELQRIGVPMDNNNLHDVRNNALIAGWIYKRKLDRVNDRLQAVGYYHKGGGTGPAAERIRGVYTAKFMENLRYLNALCGGGRQLAQQ